jgi:HK97 family phage major capsid protein/HK97 family phage prohead protease
MSSNKTINTGALHRSFDLSRDAINEEARTVELAFSSEAPVARWFGDEILDHDPKSIRLGRLNDGGPVLVDHDGTDHVGVVEQVVISGDRVGRAQVRFGKSARAEEIWQDVKDGIRKSVSVGYRIHKMALESETDGMESYRATDWEPYEISMVSVPADAQVGIGRAATGEHLTEVTNIQIKQIEESTMDTKAPEATPVVDNTFAIEDVRKAELGRITDIEAIGNQHGFSTDARAAITSGQSANEFRSHVLNNISKPAPVVSTDIGLTEKEVRNFSFMRAIHALSNPSDRRAQEAAAFEFEASRAAADQMGRQATGMFVPSEVLKRDLNVGTATAGGNTVATDLLSNSFVDSLENAMVVAGLGATMLRDLNGNVAIPRQTSGATAYWVAESGAVTESAAAFDQITMSGKTVGAFSDISRKLLLQSSIDIESFVRNDLAMRLAMAIDLSAIAGTGSSNQPTGILATTGIGSKTFAAAGNPTFGEMVDVESQVSIDNALFGSLGYVSTAAMAGAMKQKAKDSGSGQFVMANGQVNGYNMAVTNQMTANTVVFGNFADLIIGMWGGLDINVDTSTGSASGTVRVVCMQDVDIAVRHAQSFAKGSGGS